MPVPVGKYAIAKGIAVAEYQPGETGEQQNNKMNFSQARIKPPGQNEKHQENMGEIEKNIQEMQNADRGHKNLLSISLKISGKLCQSGKNMEIG